MGEGELDDHKWRYRMNGKTTSSSGIDTEPIKPTTYVVTTPKGTYAVTIDCETLGEFASLDEALYARAQWMRELRGNK